MAFLERTGILHFNFYETLMGWRLRQSMRFFSWTEHIFIHIAVLKSTITTGTEVAQLAGADWSLKFKASLDVHNPTTKGYFDKLLVIRRQMRNFMAHGEFGKEGEAFHFHSTAGAVPVAFDHSTTKQAFSLRPESPFDNAEAVKTIEEFIAHMWSGPEGPARIYLEACDNEMKEFAEHLVHQMDNAANMDW